jgi:3-hydroxybutyryl-CoA dehydrogenase
MKVAVIGAGAMGRGIAQVTAAGGHEVVIHDAHAEALSAVRGGIATGLEATVARGKLTAEDAQSALARVTTAAQLSGISDADLVIEAIIEDLDIKQRLFASIEDIVSTETVLASNTSSLSIGAIAKQMSDRERLIGLHFFNPVPAMRLVEIVVRPDSRPHLIELASSFVRSIGKTGIRVMDSPGFLVNLAGRAYVTEALAIVDENVATVDQVDRIARSVLGFPLGPFELMDLTGLDVNLPVTTNIFDAHFADPMLRSTWYHRYLHEVGLLGKKTSGGFYRYEQHPADAPTGPAPSSESPEGSVSFAVHDEELAARITAAGIACSTAADAELVVISPLGTDVSTACAAAGLDPRRTVGIDAVFAEHDVLTLMVPPGVPAELVTGLSAQLRHAFTVEIINDSPGFIAQRLLAAIVNLGCQIAQRGVAAPEDIDTAVMLGLRYPRGPLGWADHLGPSTIVEILNGQRDATGDPRYSPSSWLTRRARTGLSALTADHLPALARELRPRATL